MTQRIRDWAEETARGDVSEMPFDVGPCWQHFSVGPGDCKGKDCKYADPCHGRKARARARAANVIVCNYHVLLTHLMLKNQTGKDLLLPELDVVILDEAHKLPDLARDFFGFELRPGSIKYATRHAPRLGLDDERSRVMQAASGFFDDLQALSRDRKRYRARLRKPDAVPGWRTLNDALEDAGASWTKAGAELSRSSDPDEADFAKDVKKAAIKMGVIQDLLKDAMTMGDEDYVYSIEENKGRSFLKSKLIDPAPVIRQTLLSWARSTIMTSATLTVGSRLEHFISQVGAENPETLIAASPFDFERQALVVVPRGLPDPKGDRDKHVEGTCAAVVEAVRQAQGRTLGLFTSYRVLDAAHRAVLQAGLPYTVMRQGEAPRTVLAQRFREDTQSVLLGTESFWAGVDVPGESLSCVVVDRLPFPHMDDPIMDILADRDPDGWFFNQSVPRACVQFAQGCGRLIRSAADRGVLVILDRRIVDKAYGRTFLRSLPRMTVSRDTADIGRFLGAG